MKKQTRASKMDESLGERRGKESSKKQSYKSRRDESIGSRKSEKLTEKIPPSKKINMKGGKKVSGIKYAADKEKEEYMAASMDNHPRRKPADIAQALMRAKEGFSKKIRVKPDKMKGKGR